MGKFRFSEPSDPTTWDIPPRRIEGMTHIMDVPASAGAVISMSVTEDSVVVQTEFGGPIVIPSQDRKPS